MIQCLSWLVQSTNEAMSFLMSSRVASWISFPSTSNRSCAEPIITSGLFTNFRSTKHADLAEMILRASRAEQALRSRPSPRPAFPPAADPVDAKPNQSRSSKRPANGVIVFGRGKQQRIGGANLFAEMLRRRAGNPAARTSSLYKGISEMSAISMRDAFRRDFARDAQRRRIVGAFAQAPGDAKNFH